MGWTEDVDAANAIKNAVRAFTVSRLRPPTSAYTRDHRHNTASSYTNYVNDWLVTTCLPHHVSASHIH
jgi:hypothetical protein